MQCIAMAAGIHDVVLKRSLILWGESGKLSHARSLYDIVNQKPISLQMARGWSPAGSVAVRSRSIGSMNFAFVFTLHPSMYRGLRTLNYIRTRQPWVWWRLSAFVVEHSIAGLLK